ncbi:MAG: NADH-quinone oxidoreductase subunit NuoK [Dehalococcoidia bacterium]
MVLPDVLLAAIRLQHVLVLGALLFSIGLYLALSKRNAIGVLMGVELMLNAVNVTLIAFARFVVSPRPLDGQVFAIFVITVAAAEAAVALALVVAVYRHRETVNVDEIDVLRW